MLTRSSPFTILATAGDPGGANAVAPVLERLLQTPGAKLVACPYNEAAVLWSARGIPVRSAATMTTLDVRLLMENEQVDFLLTGTSANPRNFEHEALLAARDLAIPSLAILDYWANYALRFSSATHRLDRLPEKIAVMDTHAITEMLADGFPADRLVLTGQPAFDSLAGCRKAFGELERERLRQAYQVPPTGLLVFFASQPTSVVCGEDASNPLFLGYTERTVANLLIAALDSIANQRRRSITLVVRAHPRENGAWLRQLCGTHIRVVVAHEGSARELCMAADLVAGMDSVLLVEACYLRAFVVSIQPGLVGPDTVPTNRSGASSGIYRAAEVQPAIERLLFDPAVQAARSALLATMAATCFSAVESVARLILPHDLLAP